MGCNCGNGNSAMEYHYTSTSGQVTVYGSEVLAKAAVVKNGGSYRPVAK